MKTFIERSSVVLRWARYLLIAVFFAVQAPQIVYSQSASGLEEVNSALQDQTDQVIQTGRLVSNIIVIISFILLMLNIAFKVMDNSKATVVFLFILLLRGLYEVIF